MNTYLPDAPAAWQSITIFNLLTHTSGLHDFMSDPSNAASGYTPTTPEQLIWPLVVGILGRFQPSR